LIIDELESMTVIDVDMAGSRPRRTGRCALALNLEAAEAIARQLRLRTSAASSWSISCACQARRSASACRGAAPRRDRRSAAGRRAGHDAAGLVELTRRRGRSSLAR